MLWGTPFSQAVEAFQELLRIYGRGCAHERVAKAYATREVDRHVYKIITTAEASLVQ
jgi:hypothetical protein